MQIRIEFRTRAVAAAAVVGVAAWRVRHRRSDAVQNWRPSRLREEQIGVLSVRRGGAGPGTTLLLHGLVSSGRFWSGDYDELASAHRLLVPDLVGFGRSLADDLSTVDDAAHLTALDNLLDTVLDARDNGSGKALTLVAHSFGAALAVRLAGRRPDVDRLVLFGAPVTPDGVGADELGRHLSPMARWFGLDTRLARVACRLNCAHRGVSGLIAAALQPSLPVRVARDVSLHTWPAYRCAIDITMSTDWATALATVCGRGGEVVVVTGRDDPVPDRDTIDDLVSRWPTASHVLIGGGHRVPLEDPGTCLDIIRGAERVGGGGRRRST